MTAKVFDVADYILQSAGPMTAMKLQKLVYYCQAWSLVWDERPLFKDRIEAWANGPVVPALYQSHKGCYELKAGDIRGNIEALDEDAKETIDAVLKHYGDKTSQWLSDLTHAERPWKESRAGMKPSSRGNEEITHSSMAEYYSSL